MPTINICTRSARDIRHIQTNSTPLKEKSIKALQTIGSHALSPRRSRTPEQALLQLPSERCNIYENDRLMQ